jgi:hypothetical protein
MVMSRVCRVQAPVSKTGGFADRTGQLAAIDLARERQRRISLEILLKSAFAAPMRVICGRSASEPRALHLRNDARAALPFSY